MSSGSDSLQLPGDQALLRQMRILELRKATQEKGRDDSRLSVPQDELLELMKHKYLAMGIADHDK